MGEERKKQQSAAHLKFLNAIQDVQEIEEELKSLSGSQSCML